MARELQFKASKTQREALRLLRDNVTTEIGFGGAAGGGKSYLAVAWTWMMCMSYPGTKFFWCRNELKRLKQTTLATYYKFLAEYGIPESQAGNFNSQDSVITFANGSQILLLDGSYQPSDPLFTRFGGLECTGGVIEESNELQELAINILSSRVGRCQNDKYGIKQKVLETFNPDKGHVYRRFYKPAVGGVLPPFRAFVVSKIDDNNLVDKAYREQLEKLPEVQKQRLLHGNFEYDDTPGRLYDYRKLTDLFTNPKNNGKKYITCDVAREGKDSTAIYVWDGWECVERVKIAKSGLDAVWGKIRALADQYVIGMSNVICDEDGVGGGVVDYLKCRGFINNAKAYSNPNHKGNPWLKRNYANMKAQCYFMLKDPIEKNLIRLPDCPDKDSIIEELDAMVQVDIDKDSTLKVISKQDIKAKIGRSPDDADAIMLRMAFEFYQEAEHGKAVDWQDDTMEPIKIYGSIGGFFEKIDNETAEIPDGIE